MRSILLLITFFFVSTNVSSQITISQFNADWNSTNTVEWLDDLSDVDWIITTGGDNSADYFHYMFKDKKRIVRHTRNSIAVLDGLESQYDYENLMQDICVYFGLGCRNVSKIFIPRSLSF